MTIDDKFREEKLCNDINREAAKILTLSSGKIDKNEFFTGQDILLLIREEWQIKLSIFFAYSQLGKAFEKQTKTIEDYGKKIGWI